LQIGRGLLQLKGAKVQIGMRILQIEGEKVQIERLFANRRGIAAIKRSEGENRSENSANRKGETTNRKTACK
jgi:hypothetical protein